MTDRESTGLSRGTEEGCPKPHGRESQGVGEGLGGLNLVLTEVNRNAGHWGSSPEGFIGEIREVLCSLPLPVQSTQQRCSVHLPKHPGDQTCRSTDMVR